MGKLASRLSFGTVAALFESPAAAQTAADELVQQGYPRQLITVLTGRPWSGGDAGERVIEPDPELGVQLTPASPKDVASLREIEQSDPVLAAFVGETLARQARRRNRALWPLVALALGVVATLIALYAARGGWIAPTIVGMIAFQVVVLALILSYARAYFITFPFRSQIPAVEEALAQGGALVTVRCTLPYQSAVRAVLERSGGTVLGYAKDVVYPVPA